MNWAGWQDFVTMGGYAVYVWGAIAMVGLVLAAEVSQIMLRRRGCRQRLGVLGTVELDHEDQNKT